MTSLCASYAAIVSKLRNQDLDQGRVATPSLLRYIRMGDLLVVFMFRKNLIYLCLSKGDRSYASIHRRLEYLHMQVWGGANGS